jgi:hypothetical protein
VQNRESHHNLLTTFPLCVCASQRRFQPITRDLGGCRKMLEFALSRRQRGFESRWGYKFKVTLTRSNAPHVNGQRQVQHQLMERQGADRAVSPQTSSPTRPLRVPPVSFVCPQPLLRRPGPTGRVPISAFRSLPAQCKLLEASSARAGIRTTSTQSPTAPAERSGCRVALRVPEHKKPLYTTHSGRFLQPEGSKL